MRKLPKREMDTLVRETAGALGIDALLQRRPGELSGGQQQRVALGRAIVRRPQAFLMDEPLSNLDAKMRVQMRVELIKLHRRLDATIIFVTHDQVEAMTMGQRIAVLNQGELQQVGAPQEVYDRPANRFVAEFIGSPAMNFLEGEPQQVDGRVGVRAGEAFFALSPSVWAALQTAGSKRLVVGIRPEHLVLAATQGEGAALEGHVDLVESLGSELHVTVALAGGSVVAKAPADAPVRPDQTVRLAVEPERLHLFDAETGQRIS
jgi:multiple sugar transport system ATP-binding protein